MPPTTTADYPTYSSAADLTQGADIVASVSIGNARDSLLYPDKITSTDPQQNPSAGAPEQATREELAIPITVYEVTLVEVFAGNAKAGQKMEIKRVGHMDASSDLAELRKDTKYVLFLATYPDAPADIMGGDTGQFILSGETVEPANKKNQIKIDLRLLRGE